MSVGGIQFGGLASGLDTQAIIGALLAVEQRPIALLEQRRSTIERQRTLFGDFESLLNRLQEAAEEVENSDGFLQFRASTDDENQYFTASAGSDATPGVYDLQVRSLATNEIRGSSGSVDADTTTFGTGNLTLTVDGETSFIAIDNTNNTLNGIASAINASESGVTAQVIDTGTGANPFQLVLTSETAGSGGAISIGSDSATTDLANLASDIQGNTIRQGTNASLVFNGIEIERTTNSISDLISGVTIDLTAASELDVNGDPVDTTRLTVATDGEATGEKISAFVDAYNSVVDFVDGQFQAPPEDGNAPPLFGDATLRSVRSAIRSIVGGITDTGNAAFSLVSQVGIETETNGRLTFNSEQFTEALSEDEDAVLALFTGETGGTPFGIAGRLVSTIESYTDTVDGLLKARTDGFDRLIRDTNTQIERQERRLDQFEQQLSTRFANLEVLLNRLQGQGGALSAIPIPQ